MVLFKFKQRVFLRMVTACVLIACAQMITPSSYAQLNDGYNDFDTEDLVLAVAVERDVLSAGIFAIQKNGRVYLPIGTLSSLLGFNVDIDLNERSAEGWLITEDRTFSIDQGSNTLSYRGNSVPLPQDSILDESIAGDDLYVLKEVLDEVWPLKIEIDFSVLAIRIVPDESLPYQAFIKRKKKQEQLLAEKKRMEAQEDDKEDYPFLAYPYQLFGKPSIDIQTRAGYDARTDEVVSGVQLGGVQDIGFASADYSSSLSYRAGDIIEPRNIRLRFRRQDSYPGALPLDLKDVQWGDVNVNNRDLIEKNLRGRGATFTNAGEKFSNEFDVITIDGVGVPGYEVELYINDQLIDFDVVDDNGIYEFEEVQLTFGNNRIRTVLYGPQGQLDERTENYFYNSNMVKKGDFSYTGGILDAREDFIPIDPINDSQPRGINANLYGAYGVSERVTAFASGNIIPDQELMGRDDVSRQYLSAGALVSFPNTLLQAEAYQEIGGGQAIDLRSSGDYKGFKVNLQLAKFFDFLSPESREGATLLDYEADANVRKSFKTPIGNLSLELDGEHREREDSSSRSVVSSRQSLSLKGTRVTNRTISNLDDINHTSTSGQLSSTTRFNRWRLRNGLGYKIYPDYDITNIAADLRFGSQNDLSYAFGFQRNFDQNDTIGSFQMTKDFDKFLGSFETSLSSQNGFGFLVRASTAFGPYAEDGGYLMQSDTLRTSGPISAFIYEDKDYDGIYNNDDVPVKDTKIKIGRRVTKQETNENGYVSQMNAIYANQNIDITVDRGSIDDPYLVTSKPGGYTVYPRPGVKQSLIFPLISTGAIDGTVRWANDSRPVGGLALQLMDSNGDIAAESRTAQDGYYTFERIKPGDYTIRTNPESGLNIPFEYISLTPDDLFKFGIDIEPVDLNRPMQVDLDVGLDKDGSLNARDILSIAKGFKSNGKGLSTPSQQPRAKIQKAVQKAQNNKITAKSDNVEEDEDQKNKSSMVSEDAPQMQYAVSGNNSTKMSVLDKISARINQPDTPVTVQQVKISEAPDSSRIMLALSAPIEYSIEFDPTSNAIIVDMPYSKWEAQKTYVAKPDSLLLSYYVEETSTTGTRLVVSVDNAVKIGASGLISSDVDEKEGLYIDLVKK